MSVGQDFDRSLLERKDRAALVAIAESLGAKAPARAKKADIVDAILRAAGVDDAGAPATPEPPANGSGAGTAGTASTDDAVSAPVPEAAGPPPATPASTSTASVDSPDG